MKDSDLRKELDNVENMTEENEVESSDSSDTKTTVQTDTEDESGPPKAKKGKTTSGKQ